MAWRRAVEAWRPRRRAGGRGAAARPATDCACRDGRRRLGCSPSGAIGWSLRGRTPREEGARRVAGHRRRVMQVNQGRPTRSGRGARCLDPRPGNGVYSTLGRLFAGVLAARRPYGGVVAVDSEPARCLLPRHLHEHPGVRLGPTRDRALAACPVRRRSTSCFSTLRDRFRRRGGRAHPALSPSRRRVLRLRTPQLLPRVATFAVLGYRLERCGPRIFPMTTTWRVALLFPLGICPTRARSCDRSGRRRGRLPRLRGCANSSSVSGMPTGCCRWRAASAAPG